MNTWKKIRRENRKKWQRNEQTGFLHISISDEKMKACLTSACQTSTARRSYRRPLVAACMLALVLAVACTPLGSYATHLLFPPVSPQGPVGPANLHYRFVQNDDMIILLQEKVLDGVVLRVYAYKGFRVHLTEDHNHMDTSAQFQDGTDAAFFTADIGGVQAQCVQDADGAIAWVGDVALPCTLRVTVSGAITREDFIQLLSYIERVE